MTPEGKNMTPSGKGVSKKPVARKEGAGPLPPQVAERCPKEEKDCSTCKITVCPEEAA